MKTAPKNRVPVTRRPKFFIGQLIEPINGLKACTRWDVGLVSGVEFRDCKIGPANTLVGGRYWYVVRDSAGNEWAHAEYELRLSGRNL